MRLINELAIEVGLVKEDPFGFDFLVLAFVILSFGEHIIELLHQLSIEFL